MPTRSPSPTSGRSTAPPARRPANSASLTDTFDLSVAGNGDAGDVVSVEVTPNDGTVSGSLVSASQTVSSFVNTAPVVDTVTHRARDPDHRPDADRHGDEPRRRGRHAHHRLPVDEERHRHRGCHRCHAQPRHRRQRRQGRRHRGPGHRQRRQATSAPVTELPGHGRQQRADRPRSVSHPPIPPPTPPSPPPRQRPTPMLPTRSPSPTSGRSTARSARPPPTAPPSPTPSI